MRRSYIYGLLVWVIMISACQDNHPIQTPAASYFNTGDTGVRVSIVVAWRAVIDT